MQTISFQAVIILAIGTEKCGLANIWRKAPYDAESVWWLWEYFSLWQKNISQK